MRRTLSPGIFYFISAILQRELRRGGDVLQPQSWNLLAKIIMKDHVGLVLSR